MIQITLRGKAERVLYLNPDQVEYVEDEAGAVVVMLSGKRFAIVESRQEICERILAYRQAVMSHGKEKMI